jgi:DMSO/TMAO reductase YedYZ molybdopterin-dependent catalytic subunit
MASRHPTLRVWACVGVALAASAVGFAGQRAAHPALTVAGDVTRALSLTASELRALPRTRVEMKFEEKTLTYEGVLVAEILKRAGVPLGAELRGKAVASYVSATAQDGYQVVFSIGELDPEFTTGDIIVADTVDGQPLPAQEGPLRIAVPRDKRHSRSLRQLERLEFVRLRK